MAQLEPQADQAVRDAVEAFVEGRRLAGFHGEIAFDTKNSRYRVIDGWLVSAPDTTLVGAEMVGWLVGRRSDGTVGPSWQPGSRAVLVDRRRGEHIIVTSTTRMANTEGFGTTTESTTQSFAARPLSQPTLRRTAPVHAPPRPIGARPANGPLPYPVPPPRREVPPAPPSNRDNPDSMTPFFLSRVTRQGAVPTAD